MIQKRWLIVTVYVSTLILLYADHNLLSPNLTQIAEEFGMSNKERDLQLGGHISLAFYAVGVPSSLTFGWISDSIQRRPSLFAMVVFIGEIACFATYFVNSFGMLLFTRSVTGVGIGGCLPIIYSILGDMFQAEGRNIAAAIISTATGLGLGIGQAMAGFLGPNFGWRLPFLIVSVPSFCFAVICCFLEDPPRGSKEQSVMIALQQQSDNDNDVINTDDQENIVTIDQGGNIENEGKEDTNDDTCISPIDDRTHLSTRNEERPIHDMYPVESTSLKSTCKLLSTPTVMLLLIQGAPSVLPFGITSTFLNDYLAQDKGLKVQEATGVLLTFGAGNAIGVIIGGTMGHLLYKKDKRFPPLAMGIAILLSCVPMWFVINMEYEDKLQIVKASIAMFFAGVLSICPIPIERAILSNVSLPEARGRANSFLSLIDDIGKALGPFLLSTMISSLGRQKSFNWSLTGWIIGGVVSCLQYFTVRTDEDTIQKIIAEKIEERNITEE